MKPRPFYGAGDPSPDFPAKFGQPYIDRRRGQIWYMGGNGWERASVVSVNPMKAQKDSWVAAARRAGQRLEDWIFEKLDRSAK